MYERKPPRPFQFTERELLFDVVGTRHFLELMQAEETTIHQAELSTNSYGEFLFVTASRAREQQREVITFWGLGLHERRDRYLLDEWHWYQSYTPIDEQTVPIPKDEFLTLLTERRQALEEDGRGYVQTKRGQFYEMLADLTDEDGAATEMDDLGESLDDLFDDE